MIRPTKAAPSATKEDDQATRAKFKRIIDDEFFPAHGDSKVRVPVIRKVVRDYEKVAPSAEAVADVMMYVVERAVVFAETFGYDHGPFYVSVSTAYDDALEWITEHGLEEEFSLRCYRILPRCDGLGWGLFEEMVDLHARYLDLPDGVEV